MVSFFKIVLFGLCCFQNTTGALVVPILLKTVFHTGVIVSSSIALHLVCRKTGEVIIATAMIILC